MGEKGELCSQKQFHPQGMEPGRSKFCSLLPREKEVMQPLASLAGLLFKINMLLTPVRAGAAVPRGSCLSAPCAVCSWRQKLPSSGEPGGGRTALENTSAGTSFPDVLGEQ